MANMKEKESVTGLDMAEDRNETEYNLVKALLEASSYKTDENSITEVTIARNGKFLFKVNIHPVSDSDVKQAKKQAGIYRDNPNNKKLGKVRVDTDDAKFNSWLIYLATTEADQSQIWGNRAVMDKFNLMQPWESIDYLLNTGEKAKLLEKVLEISGLGDDDETMDDETFQ